MIKKNYVILCLLITSLSLFGATAEKIPTPPASPESALEDLAQIDLNEVTVPGATGGNVSYSFFGSTGPENQEVASITEKTSGASAEASKALTPPLAAQRTSATPTTNPLTISVSASSEETVQESTGPAEVASPRATPPVEEDKAESHRPPSSAASDDSNNDDAGSNNSFVSVDGQPQPDDESVKAFFRKPEKSTPAHKATGPRLDANGAGAADPEPEKSAADYERELDEWLSKIELKIVNGQIRTKTFTIRGTSSEVHDLSYLQYHFLQNPNELKENSALTKDIKIKLIQFNHMFPDAYDTFITQIDTKQTDYFTIDRLVKLAQKTDVITREDKFQILSLKKEITGDIFKNKDAQSELFQILDARIAQFELNDEDIIAYEEHITHYANTGYHQPNNPFTSIQDLLPCKDAIDTMKKERKVRETTKLKIGYGLTTATTCALPWLNRIPMARTMASSAFGFLHNTFGRATLPVIAGTGLLAAYATAPSFFRMLNGGEQSKNTKKLISRASILGFSSGISFSIAQGFSGLGSLGLGVAGMIGVTALAVLTEHQNKIRNSGYAFKEITRDNLKSRIPGITQELTALQEASRARFLIAESEA